MKPRAIGKADGLFKSLLLPLPIIIHFGVRICSRADSTGLGSFRFTYEIPVGTLGVWKEGLANESRHLILISRLKMMKNELWCLAAGKSWWSVVDHFLELLNCRNFTNFPSLSDGWEPKQRTLPSRVDQGFLDNWTSKPRIFIETRKSAPSRGLCLPLAQDGRDEISPTFLRPCQMELWCWSRPRTS